MVKKKEEPYNLNQIKCLETIWGEGFLSPGGKDEIDQVLDGFDLENMNVIDIGCGTGGAAFHISNHYGAKSVAGVDTGPMVIKRANELLNSNKADNVTFNVISPGPYEFEDNSFDAIFSKDTFIHIPDKENLCKELYRILKPGGFLAASDWMRRDDNPLSKQMYEYIQTEDLDMNMCSLSRYKDALLSSGFIDIKLRDTSYKDEESELYLPFVLNEAKNIFQGDSDKKIITENNEDFLTECGAIKNYKYNDGFLRPPLVSKCIYDFLSGSNGSSTPLRYDINFRNYYYVTEGEIDVKLIPPHSSKYLYSKNDYDNFEFRSPVDPWNVEEKYRADYDKIKSLDVNIKKGTILYIPPYWWYSIKYNNASVCTFKYRTFMNSLAIMPQSVLGLLQSQNIKRDVVSKLDLKETIKQEVKEEVQKQTSSLVNDEDVTEIEDALKTTVGEVFANN